MAFLFNIRKNNYYVNTLNITARSRVRDQENIDCGYRKFGLTRQKFNAKGNLKQPYLSKNT